ncbi:hypothetical protein HNR46_002157 [Haloferula luteola]|uniref:Uncharacterized protein n=1 Tax=Haloferula luteola TaxID=595692 RepID=A0A840VB59_9BACT|nr:hypothetical protein [Haloferula luteola]MBB5351918.1 hypothetical protein [Haloferula luteola]
MSQFGFRPHFTLERPGSPAEEQRRLAASLQRLGETFKIKSFPGFLCLRVPPAERHFWSPRLHVSFEPTEQGHTQLDGVYGPNANLWSLFLYGYLLASSAGLFGGALGWAQHALAKPAWGFAILAGALALALGLYLVAQFGQKIAAQQTFRLHQLIEAALKASIPVH